MVSESESESECDFDEFEKDFGTYPGIFFLNFDLNFFQFSILVENIGSIF